LDLPELGAEGTAKVLRIGPCPPIAAGNGHIVTASFKHEPDGELLTVTIDGEEIGWTANHPFWSEDRQEFVEAGQLRVGERVCSRLEQIAAVVAIKPRPPTTWVYNLEVQGEHVYEVGPSGVLVHNRCEGLHHFWPRS
ncbi:MAG: Hint domain-containing protein, partial [Gemmataceae bacterium]|nr:Hint domain-containing protein [Gemmataceae bacterium]